MAFNQTQTKPRNQFVARMVSNKLGTAVNFVNLTDEFVRKAFGVATVTDVTAEQAVKVLPVLLNNDRVSVVITDTTAELQTVALEDF